MRHLPYFYKYYTLYTNGTKDFGVMFRVFSLSGRIASVYRAISHINCSPSLFPVRKNSWHKKIHIFIFTPYSCTLLSLFCRITWLAILLAKFDIIIEANISCFANSSLLPCRLIIPTLYFNVLKAVSIPHLPWYNSLISSSVKSCGRFVANVSYSPLFSMKRTTRKLIGYGDW